MSEKFFVKLLNVSAAHAQMSRKVFVRLGLTEGQPKILYILRRENGCVQKELAEFSRVRPSTLTVLLAKMEEKNLIRREACYVSGMKRAYRVYLTDEGWELAEKLEAEVDIMEEKCYADFSEEEKETLLRLMCKVEGNIREE